MSGHEWVRTDGPAERPLMSLTYHNTWTCSRCGARSASLTSKPSERSRVDSGGHVGTGRGTMSCDEWIARSVLRS